MKGVKETDFNLVGAVKDVSETRSGRSNVNVIV